MNFVLWVITCWILIHIIDQQSKFRKETMAIAQEIKDLLVEQKAVIEEVAGDIAELIAKLETGLTADEATEVYNALKANVEKLKEAAAVVAEPAPEEPPVEG